MDDDDPFSDLSPLLVRLPTGDARRIVDEVKPLDLYHPVSDPPLGVRHLTAMRTRAYARILHPVSVTDENGLGACWHWSQIGSSPISADTSLQDVLDGAANFVSTRKLTVNPQAGRLDHVSTTAIASLIRDGGLACPACHFYFWDGLGIFRGRGPYVYRGSVVAVGCFFRAASLHPQTYSPWWRFQSPTLWWCQRSWFVATHPDATSTYVGGPESLIKRIVGSQELEAMRVSAEALVDGVVAADESDK
jgi:hypothetical protein